MARRGGDEKLHLLRRPVCSQAEITAKVTTLQRLPFTVRVPQIRHLMHAGSRHHREAKLPDPGHTARQPRGWTRTLSLSPEHMLSPLVRAPPQDRTIHSHLLLLSGSSRVGTGSDSSLHPQHMAAMVE